MIKNKIKIEYYEAETFIFLSGYRTLAVACSEVNENSLTDGDGQRMLRTISSGNDRFSTRLNSETSEWENGDAIGIYMFDTEDKNVLNDALNVKYTTIGEGLTVNFVRPSNSNL